MSGLFRDVPVKDVECVVYRMKSGHSFEEVKSLVSKVVVGKVSNPRVSPTLVTGSAWLNGGDVLTATR